MMRNNVIDADCEARQRRAILIAAVVGSLATIGGLVLQAFDFNANSSHFIAGFGAGLTLVTTIALVRFRRR